MMPGGESLRLVQGLARHGGNLHHVTGLCPVIDEVADRIGRGPFQRRLDRGAHARRVRRGGQAEIADLFVGNDQLDLAATGRQRIGLGAQIAQGGVKIAVVQRHLVDGGPSLRDALQQGDAAERKRKCEIRGHATSFTIHTED
ncbi:hypothetical protein ACOXXX_19260 [Thalassococcus sp. BH17M4-6]|uniref:hypothetical protein n=1 Tax=Thalassococcus sp. BH17M4-6 TaxID=3413148 RepID=UPI003BBBDD4A